MLAPFGNKSPGILDRLPPALGRDIFWAFGLQGLKSVSILSGGTRLRRGLDCWGALPETAANNRLRKSPIFSTFDFAV